MQPQLPPGYRLDYSDPNVLTLCSPQETVVARFSAGLRQGDDRAGRVGALPEQNPIYLREEFCGYWSLGGLVTSP